MPDGSQRLSPHADDLPRQQPPQDPWAVGKLDLDAYLSRAGLSRAATSRPPPDTLHSLHTAHPAALPPAKLAITQPRTDRVGRESIQDRLYAALPGGAF